MGDVLAIWWRLGRYRIYIYASWRCWPTWHMCWPFSTCWQFDEVLALWGWTVYCLSQLRLSVTAGKLAGQLRTWWSFHDVLVLWGYIVQMCWPYEDVLVIWGCVGQLRKSYSTGECVCCSSISWPFEDFEHFLKTWSFENPHLRTVSQPGPGPELGRWPTPSPCIYCTGKGGSHAWHWIASTQTSVDQATCSGLNPEFQASWDLGSV
jgi:hypothetical protein